MAFQYAIPRIGIQYGAIRGKVALFAGAGNGNAQQDAQKKDLSLFTHPLSLFHQSPPFLMPEAFLALAHNGHEAFKHHIGIAVFFHKIFPMENGLRIGDLIGEHHASVLQADGGRKCRDIVSVANGDLAVWGYVADVLADKGDAGGSKGIQGGIVLFLQLSAL